MPLVEEHAKCEICHRTETKNRTESGMAVCLSCDVLTGMPRDTIKDIEVKLLRAISLLVGTDIEETIIYLKPDEAKFLLEAYRQLEQKVINARRQEVIQELYKLREEKQRLTLRISDLEKVLDDMKFKGFSAIKSSK